SERLTAQSQGHPYVPRQHPNRKLNELLAKKYVYDDPNGDPKIKQALHVFNDLLADARYRPVTLVGQMLWNQHCNALEDAVFHKNTAREALTQAEGIVQQQLDAGLQPRKGIRLEWSWLLIPYVLLV